MSIVLENITKSFGENKVIDSFNLSVENGEKLCIMGESGSGKTTLLSIIAGLVKPDAGNVSGTANKKLAMVFQDDRLADELTVYRNIKLVCGKSVNRQSVSDALNAVGLSAELLNVKINTLSGGMKRRIAILRALLCDADIILMDEPTKGLDDENKQLVIEYILSRSKDKILIWVTHDTDEAKYVSDRIIEI